MKNLKLLILPLVLLSVATLSACNQSVEPKAKIDNLTSYDLSQATGDGEEMIEDRQDDLDLDNLDQQPVYDGQPGEEIIEDPEDVSDSDNFDQTSVDPAYSNTGEEAIENPGDVLDADNFDQQPVYDGQPGEEAIEDPADEADLDNMDQVEIEN